MKLDTDHWYRCDKIFDDALTTGDGTRLSPARHSFAGGTLSAAMLAPALDTYLALQCSLDGVDQGAVDGLPSLSDIALDLISQNLLPLPQSRFPFELHLRHPAGHFLGEGLVCAELMIHSLDARSGPSLEKLREVEHAFERGLLDEALHSRADFRLRIRPLMQEVEALRDTGYVPGWRINVIFAAWRTLGEGGWVKSPLTGFDWSAFELCFIPTSRERGFRLTDLLSKSAS